MILFNRTLLCTGYDGSVVMLQQKGGANVFGFIIRILLIWWLLTTLFKWLNKPASTERTSQSAGNEGNSAHDSDPSVVHSGTIEDADFEEIDDK